jgi:hypothetical protein
MLKCVFSASLLGFALITNAQIKGEMAGPKIEFDEVRHNFGNIQEDIHFATHRFKFKNTGTRDLFINTVQTSCGCTTPDWTRDTVHPGEAGYVDAKYETTGRIGEFNKTITVYSNAANAPFVHLDISGNVQKEAMPTDFVQPDYGKISFSSQTVAFPQLYDNQVDSIEVRITNSSTFTTNFNPLSNLPAHCQIKGFPQSLEPNESAKIKIIVNGRLIKGYGYGAFEIPISSDHPVMPYTGMYVTYTLKQFFPKMNAKALAKAPKLVVDKKSHDFGPLESGDIVKSEFKFTNAGKSDLKIHEIFPNCACVKVEYSNNIIKPGETLSVKITYDSGIKKGKSTTSLWVVCNDPTEPERYLYVTANMPVIEKKSNCATCPK